MKAAARLNYLALGCAIAPALLVAVSCGGEDAAPAGAGTALASPTPVPSPTVTPGMWSPPADLPSVPVSESDALWRDIWTNAVLVEPVLQPIYLPASLTRVGVLESGNAHFDLLYSGWGEGETWLLLSAAPAEKFRQPGSREEQIPIRHTLATYLLWDPAAPTGDAWLCWDDPGSWGEPGGSPGNIPLPQDHVTYCITSRGLPKEELIRVAEALRPVESLLAVPTRVPFVPIAESDLFWQRVAVTATSIDPILRPTYLPSSIERIWQPDWSSTNLGVVYSDSTGQTWVSVAAGALNPPPTGPNGLVDEVEVRGIAAFYQLEDKNEPLGLARVEWEQPGSLADPPLDHVTYVVTSSGLPNSKEELLKVANSLEPVEP